MDTELKPGTASPLGSFCMTMPYINVGGSKRQIVFMFPKSLLPSGSTMSEN